MNGDPPIPPDPLCGLIEARTHVDAALVILDRLDESLVAVRLVEALEQLDRRIQLPK